MRTAVLGAGPAGLVLGAALARRGAEVIIVDRDPGPARDGRWPRKGVMQFHHAHGVRPQVTETLQRELPDAYRRMLAAGAEPVEIVLPDGASTALGTRCRRMTLERAIRDAAVRTPNLTIRQGHVDGVTEADGRASGLLVDGSHVAADLVVDASGRSGRVDRHRRAAPTAGGPCAIAYVDRQYQLLPGAEPGPLVNPIAWQAGFDGYQCLVFLHEHGIFSVLLLRPSEGRDMHALRHNAVFDAAARAIPGLAEWTDPQRSRPITDVRPGGSLKNTYRSQRGPHGGLALPGLLFVGDAVCTTTPNFGRGLATTMLQVDEVLGLVDRHLDPARDAATSQVVAVGESFDAWAEANMRPWVEDHAVMDEGLRQRWAGRDIDLTKRIPSDLILEAAKVEPRIGPVAGAYVAMRALPAVLHPVEPLARAVYATGWRPTPADGPTRAQLADLISRVAA